MATDYYGKLLIVGKDGSADLEFPMDKKTILIGRCAWPRTEITHLHAVDIIHRCIHIGAGTRAATSDW